MISYILVVKIYSILWRLVCTICSIVLLVWNIYSLLYWWQQIKDLPNGAQSHQVALLVMLRSAGRMTEEQFLCSSLWIRQKHIDQTLTHSRQHYLRMFRCWYYYTGVAGTCEGKINLINLWCIWWELRFWLHNRKWLLNSAASVVMLQ